MKRFRALLAIVILSFAGFQLYAQQTPAPGDAKLLELRAKLNGVWTVDTEKTKIALGYGAKPLPPFLQGTLESYQSSTFEFRPGFIVMNFAEGGSQVSDQLVDLQDSTNMESVSLLLFESNEKLSPKFVGVVFTSTNTVFLLRGLIVFTLCITRNTNAVIVPYGQPFEMKVPGTYGDIMSASNRAAFKNRLESTLKTAKLGMLIDARYELPKKGLLSEKVFSVLEQLNSAANGELLKSNPVSTNTPASHVYRLELYDFPENREVLGLALKNLGCPEDTELKPLASGPEKIVRLEELLKKK